MKIAIFCHDLSGGGAERVAVVLASGLAEKKHYVTVIAEYERAENLVYLDRSVNVQLLRGNSRLARAAALLKHLRAEQYDIVHTINPLLTVQVLILKFLVGSKPLLIGSYHGLYAQVRQMPGLLGRFSYYFTPLLTRLAVKNVCVSKTVESDLIEHWGAKPNNLVTIYNPVAVRPTSARYDPVSPDLPAHYILFVGRLSNDKNPALALRALALLPERFSNFVLIILGVGPLRTELERLADELKIRERVRFVGYVMRAWTYFENATVFVSTSNAEAFGLVIVEAMACGVSVIATKSGGPEEILENGRFGALVPVGDAPAFSSAIISTIDRPFPKELLRARAVEFSVDGAVSAYEDLFNQVVIENRAKKRRRSGAGNRAR
jgi:glycosyltransferase involved in cell wall biosynthesis